MFLIPLVKKFDTSTVFRVTNTDVQLHFLLSRNYGQPCQRPWIDLNYSMSFDFFNDRLNKMTVLNSTILLRNNYYTLVEAEMFSASSICYRQSPERGQIFVTAISPWVLVVLPVPTVSSAWWTSFIMHPSHPAAYVASMWERSARKASNWAALSIGSLVESFRK